MKLNIICVAYERPIQMRMLVDNFIIQTNPNWELCMVYDGPAPQNIQDIIDLYDNEKRVVFVTTPERKGQFGHPNRKMMLDLIKCADDDFILMTNDDNLYAPVFVEYFLSHCTPNVGMVYCNTIHNYMAYEILTTAIAVKLIDMGSFIVRADVAKKVGFNYMDAMADGMYAVECYEECKKRGLASIHISKAIFMHN